MSQRDSQQTPTFLAKRSQCSNKSLKDISFSTDSDFQKKEAQKFPNNNFLQNLALSNQRLDKKVIKKSVTNHQPIAQNYKIEQEQIDFEEGPVEPQFPQLFQIENNPILKKDEKEKFEAFHKQQFNELFTEMNFDEKFRQLLPIVIPPLKNPRELSQKLFKKKLILMATRKSKIP